MALPSLANIVDPEAEGYDALLDYGNLTTESLYLQFVFGAGQRVERRTASPERLPGLQQRVTDVRPESGSVFSRDSFIGGEGLDRAFRSNAGPTDPIRFWDSKGIDISIPDPGEIERIRLLLDTEQSINSASINGRAAKIASSPRVYWPQGTNVVFHDDLTGAGLGTSEDPHAAEGAQTVLDVATLGDVVYAAITTNGIHQRTGPATWVHWSSLAALRLWSAKDRIIASDGPSLYEAAVGSSSVLLKTLASGESWTDVVDAGSVVLAAATDGNVYAFSDEAGALVLRGQTEMLAGEIPYALAYAQGLVFIGIGEPTTSGVIGRLYVAQLTGARLRGSQLIRQWGEDDPAFDHAPRSLLVTREAVYMGVIEDGTEVHLWKYLLATAGLVRHSVYVPSGGSAAALTILTVNDNLIGFFENSGVGRQSASGVYESSGYLISPLIDFLSVADKSWVGLRMDMEAVVDAGAQVELAYTTDPLAIENPASGSWVVATTITTTEGTLDGEFHLEEVASRYIALKLTLTRSTATTESPAVRSFSVRGYEDLGDIVIEMPVNVSDLVERPGKKPMRVEGHGLSIYNALLALERQSVILTLLRTGEEIRGILESVDAPQIVRAPRGSTSRLAASVTVRGVKA